MSQPDAFAQVTEMVMDAAVVKAEQTGTDPRQWFGPLWEATLDKLTADGRGDLVARVCGTGLALYADEFAGSPEAAQRDRAQGLALLAAAGR
jgi:hypothetical protein